MEPIHVPGPPKEAFNKNRPISDLIKAQIKHLKHLEEKLPASLRVSIPQHPLVSESDAALYIAPMTRLLRSQGTTANADRRTMKPTKAPVAMPVRRAKPLALAAAEAPGKPKQSAAAASKPTPAKKVTRSSRGKQ